MNIGFGEILLILLVTLLLFGAKRLPDLARSMGKSLGEFRRAMSESGDDPVSRGKTDDETGAKG